MKIAVLFLAMILVLSTYRAHAQNNRELTAEEIEFLEHAKQKGLSTIALS